MGINDYGGASPDTLATPPLGGPGGWAESVALALDQQDISVNTRIAAAMDSLSGSWTYAADWVPYTEPLVTRVGDIVVLNGAASHLPSVDGLLLVGTIEDPRYRPAAAVGLAVGVASVTTGAEVSFTYISIRPDNGNIEVWPGRNWAETWTIGISIAYRAEAI